jgi:uncharacterized protein
METPFKFGKVVTELEFTNRTKEIRHLQNNFQAGTNTILISPRRWGKSSLVKKAAALLQKKNKKILFCMIDLFNIRSEEQFYQLLAENLIKISSTKWEDRIETTKNFIGRFIPKLSYTFDNLNEFSISLDWQEVIKNPDDIINLAERIAVNKKIRIVVCIDEFQNINVFDDPLAFQKKLRANWQNHQSASYCLYGSKRNMMTELFASASMPFYKFGDIFFLEKIELKEWESFIVKRFKDTDKIISTEAASLIATSVELHPYYTQQLAQQSWFLTEKICNNEVVLKALDNIILQLSLLFQNLTDSLTSTQINFLKALLDEEKQMSSRDTLEKYQLGTSANIIRIKEALINKEIIDTSGSEIILLDPIYKHWLKKYYFLKR